MIINETNRLFDKMNSDFIRIQNHLNKLHNFVS